MTELEILKTKDFFKLLLKSNINQSLIELLINNGFDSWVSISELNKNILEEIGITNKNDINKIVTCVKTINKIFISENSIEHNNNNISNISVENLKLTDNVIKKNCGLDTKAITNDKVTHIFLSNKLIANIVT